MKSIVVVALVLLLGLQQELAHAQCSALFASSGNVTTSDSTDRLISYLSQLLESNAIGERELVTLREGINLISHQQSPYGPVFETSARRIQYQVVQAHMQSGGLDQARIRSWAEQKLEEKSKVRVQREEVREETQSPSQKMEFHRLPPGEFEMGEKGGKVPVKLTHTIEMMSTPITQQMWVEVMGENPSYFKEGPDSIEVEVNGKLIQMQPDHPVENISWWSAVVFANRLSEKMGLKPAYDLSDVMLEGRAEDGSLYLSALDCSALKINAPSGDIYQAEGFRLPTEAEQEYVLTDMGRTKGEYPHDLSEAELSDYAQFGDPKGSTQPVGTTRKALIVAGRAFHDLIGNVWEWGHDGAEKNFRALTGGDNPQVFPGLDRHVFSGGGFGSEASSLRAGYRLYDPSGYRNRNLGARLVRTVEIAPPVLPQTWLDSLTQFLKSLL